MSEVKCIYCDGKAECKVHKHSDRPLVEQELLDCCLVCSRMKGELDDKEFCSRINWISKLLKDGVRE